jgi:hypothetical protein
LNEKHLKISVEKKMVIRMRQDKVIRALRRLSNEGKENGDQNDKR